MRAQHIIPVSGGKDSQAVICLAVERAERRGFGNLPPRFVHCDVGSNEHQATIDHIGYLSEWLQRQLGASIEFLRADFTEALAERRRNIRDDWSKAKVLRRHTSECKDLTKPMSWKDRREHRLHCDCLRIDLPAIDDELIEAALALLHPTGDPFVDLTLTKGRFPSSQARFCTERLKMDPMTDFKRLIWAEGINTIEWVGERAEESQARARKPMLQRIRQVEGTTSIIYRPIHQLKAEDVFEIAARHNLDPNPLYLQGARRVGCWPCIMCGKDELINIANRTPEHIARMREWENLVSKVSRQQAASFFSSSDVPGGDVDWSLGRIDNVIQWARTGYGGRQFDLLRSAEIWQADADGLLCDSAYGLCE